MDDLCPLVFMGKERYGGTSDSHSTCPLPQPQTHTPSPSQCIGRWRWFRCGCGGGGGWVALQRGGSGGSHGGFRQGSPGTVGPSLREAGCLPSPVPVRVAHWPGLDWPAGAHWSGRKGLLRGRISRPPASFLLTASLVESSLVSCAPADPST